MTCFVQLNPDKKMRGKWIVQKLPLLNVCQSQTKQLLTICKLKSWIDSLKGAVELKAIACAPENLCAKLPTVFNHFNI